MSITQNYLTCENKPMFGNVNKAFIEKSVKRRLVSDKVSLFEENKDKIQTFLLIKKKQGNTRFLKTNLTLILDKPETVDAHLIGSKCANSNITLETKASSDTNTFKLMRSPTVNTKIIEKYMKPNKSLYFNTSILNKSSISDKFIKKQFPKVEEICPYLIEKEEPLHNSKRIIRTTLSAVRIKKCEAKNKETFPNFPQLQTPIREKLKGDCKVFSKSFADLKCLPIYRLSIESNMFSRLRKYRGRLK